MNLRNHSPAFFTMLLLGAAAFLFLSGCATTGMDRSVKTSNSIKEVASDIRKIAIQSDVTAKSLDSLINAGQPGLKKTFNNYSEEVVRLDSQGKKVLKHIDEMKSRSTEYFAEWQKQGETYTNPQIRDLSDERRNKLAEIYARVPAAGVGIKRAYLAYLVDLKEIQTYLSNDLTPDGVIAITPVAEKSDQDAEALKRSLEPVITALDEISAELYSGKK